MLVLILGPASLLLAGLVGFMYWNFLTSRTHWKNKGIAYKKPRFLTGNFAEAGSKNLGVIFRELYEEGKYERIFGVWQFTMPVLMIIDPELVKRVLVADFTHFDDHGVYFDEKTDPLAANLLTMGGSAWRNLRAKLNPAFTTGKLKMMFPIMLKCSENLVRVLRKPAENQAVVEFKDLFARFTTDVISSCAFGIEANSLENDRAIFRTMGKKVFQSSWEVLWRNFIGFLFPNLAKLFKVWKNMNKTRKIRIYPKQLTEFFVGVIRETVAYREANNLQRNDILQMLIQLKNEGFISETDVSIETRGNPCSESTARAPAAVELGGEVKKECHFTKSVSDSAKSNRHIRLIALCDLIVFCCPDDKGEKFTCEQVAAQAFIFFTAGFETSSTTMQYALYELAVHPDIQNKVRDEIKHVLSKSGSSLTYEALQQMSYLNRVLEETLRKYPPATNLSRVCTKDYQLPGTDIVLEKGTQVSVSVLGMHWDDRYYPHPDRFDPDRFTQEQKASRPPCTYLPFGEGPRTCIGQRFGVTQTKLGLISILSHYQVSISKTKTRIPPKYDPKSFFSAPDGGMFLKVSLLLPTEKLLS